MKLPWTKELLERPLEPAERKQARQMLKEGHDGTRIARALRVSEVSVYDFIAREQEAEERKAEERRRQNPLGAVMEQIDQTMQVMLQAKASTDPKWLEGIAKQRLEAALAQHGLNGKSIPGDGMGAVALERTIGLVERLLANPQGQNIALGLLQKLTPAEEKDRMIAELLAQNQALQQHIAGTQGQAQITEQARPQLAQRPEAEPEPEDADRPRLRLVPEQDDEQEDIANVNLADLDPNQALQRWLRMEPQLAAAECRLYADAHTEYGDLGAIMQMSSDEFLRSPFGAALNKMLLMPLMTEQGKAWFAAFKTALQRPEPAAVVESTAM